MQVNSINCNQRSKCPAFTAFSLSSGAEDAMRKIFKPEDWRKFREITELQKKNPVDIVLFGEHNGKRLSGRIVPDFEYQKYVKVKDYHWRPYFPFCESVQDFLHKLSFNANMAKAKIDKMKEIITNEEIEEILKSMKN